MWIIKLFSLLSNFLPFGGYVLCLSFMNGGWIFRGVMLAVVILQILCALLMSCIIKIVIKKYPKNIQRYKIVRISRDRTSSLNFLISNIVPLISINLNHLASIIFTILVILIIAILFLKNNLYIYNPILEIWGYKIYNLEIVDVEYVNVNHTITKTLITKDTIPINTELEIINSIDDISFIK